MKLLITGGCGFVGLNLLGALTNSPVKEIRIVDNLTNSSRGSLEAVLNHISDDRVRRVAANQWIIPGLSGEWTVKLIEADIRDAEAMYTVSEGVDATINLAAQSGVPASLDDPRFDLEQNVIGAFNLLEACRAQSVGTFITASSAAVLGDAAPPQKEDQRILPLSPYGASKAATEIYCSAYNASFGLNTLAFRFSNVYGPFSWRKGSVVALFIKKLLSGEAICINGDGSQRRDFLYVSDLAEVVADAALGRLQGAVPWGEAVNISTGIQTSVAHLAECIQREAERVGAPCTIEYAPARAGDVSASAPSPQRLEILQPTLKMRRLEEGLPQTVDWFVQDWRT